MGPGRRPSGEPEAEEPFVPKQGNEIHQAFREPNSGDPSPAFHQGQAAAMVLRLAACERRMDHQESQGPLLHRVMSEIQQLREGTSSLSRSSEERIAQLSSSLAQSHREASLAQEQLKALQAEFREFTSHSMSRQSADRSEIGGQVGQALALQKVNAEEWRSAVRNKDALVQNEIDRLMAGVEDLREKQISSQAELRVRLSTLEAPAMAGRAFQNGVVTAGAGAGGYDSAYLSQAVEYLREQLDTVRQGSFQASAGLTDMKARLDSEAASRFRAQSAHGAQIEALSQALGSSHQDLAQSIAQRLEVLEAKHGV
ncbi:unnamed protein product [Polarella glacialis]|uniref:Uncharacterized protein n=1 Tax=Polarella glacialis TaxID=89957 RepID=A0A813D7E3_POLGL|nr:unnamed protein product [Polarella glacialis]